MAISFTDWEGTCLAHHGIKGQKWGVRRFQNQDGSLTNAGKEHYNVVRRLINKRYQRKDGSLTDAGVAKIAKNNTWYLTTTSKERRRGKAKEREKVADQRNKEYWDAVSKGMSTSTPSKRDRELWDGYKDRYAKAVLKDAKLDTSKVAREQVKKILKAIDASYNYRYYDDVNQGRIDTREEMAENKKRQQVRNDMIHYRRAKRKAARR